jgi:hypothetical protein
LVDVVFADENLQRNLLSKSVGRYSRHRRATLRAKSGLRRRLSRRVCSAAGSNHDRSDQKRLARLDGTSPA